MSKTMPKITVPFPVNTLPQGLPFCIFDPSLDTYNACKVGDIVVLSDTVGGSISATVTSRKFDILYNLSSMFGPTYPPMIGKAYDVSAFADRLEQLFPDDSRAAAINKHYTVVSFDPLTQA